MLLFSTKSICNYGEKFMKKIILLLLALGVLPLFANPVTPRKRYRAEFEARTIHKAYPLDWYCANLKFNYPGISFRFANSKGREIRTCYRSPFYVVTSDKFAPGSIEFYAPDKAAKLVLRKAGVVVRNLKVIEVPIGKDLAVTPNDRVQGPVRNAEITVNPDGSAIFDTSTNGVVESLPVPVKPGQRYRLTIRGGNGTRGGKKSSLIIRYYFYKSSSDRKSISSNKEGIRLGGKRDTLTYEMQAPANAKWFTIWCMWAKFYSFSLEEI